MIILDTNVVSELSKSLGNVRVAKWANSRPEGSLYLTAVSVAEMFTGIATMPDGKRKEAMRLSVEQTVLRLGTRILPFDREAAMAFPLLVLRAKAQRYTLPVADGYIAAIAAARSCVVATRDVDPFRAAGVAVIDPWEEP